MVQTMRVLGIEAAGIPGLANNYRIHRGEDRGGFEIDVDFELALERSVRFQEVEDRVGQFR